MPTRHPEEYQRMLRRLRKARLEAGMTQEQVAKHLGVRQTVISKDELGERRIDVVELSKLADLYGKPLEFFAG